MDKSANEKQEKMVYKVAAASSDGIVINQHFGRADTFYIYGIAENGKYRLLETRKVTPICNSGNHNDSKLLENVNKFRDCKYILVNRIGTGAANVMAQSDIIPIELPGIIGESINRLTAYEQLQNLF